MKGKNSKYMEVIAYVSAVTNVGLIPEKTKVDPTPFPAVERFYFYS